MITFNISCEKHLKQLIKLMLPKITKYKYHIFVGTIGVGKTTIIKQILEALSVNPDNITSPTFNYLKTIDCDIGRAVHIDLYRIDEIAKAKEIFECEEADIYLIEWGKILLEDDGIYKTIKHQTTIWGVEKSFNVRILNIDRNLI